MIYLDASYLVRLYYKDRGFEAIRYLASTDTIACAQHGQAEVVAALHRKYCEGSLELNSYRVVLQEFTDEIEADAFRWLALSQAILDRICLSFAELSASSSFAHLMPYIWRLREKTGFARFIPMIQTC